MRAGKARTILPFARKYRVVPSPPLLAENGKQWIALDYDVGLVDKKSLEFRTQDTPYGVNPHFSQEKPSTFVVPALAGQFE